VGNGPGGRPGNAPSDRSGPEYRGTMIAAVVLAAGTSSRMREPKPLVRLGGEPLLSHVLRSVAGARVGETVVVLGYEADRVRSELSLDGARVVENRAYREGMSTSLRAGVAALSPRADAFLVVLGDAPFVRSSTLDALIDARERTGARIALPTFEGMRGNPVLIDRSLADEVDALTGDRGCRALRLRHPEETIEVPVDDPGVVIDLDSPDDVRQAQAALDRGDPLYEVARAQERARHPLAPATSAPRPRTRGREDVFALVSELERRREPFCLAIVTRVQAPTSGKPGFKAIVKGDGTLVGWVGGSCSRHALLTESRAALEDGVPRVLRLRPGTEACPPAAPGVVDRVMECQSGGAMDIYLEPHGPRPQLVVVGDSPLAESLSALGRMLGFRVVAAGPGLDPARFPDADEIVGDLSALAPKLDRTTSAVVATMAQYDGMAVEILARSPAPYVALVASRRRAGLLLDDLRGQGVPSEVLARVRTPAGIDIGAKTPEEIALSIAAEIIRERARSSAEAPSVATTPAPPPEVAVDPVCHMEVEKETTPLRSVHAGATYYFCSESCLRRFQEAPGDFLD
jgi:xanthine dehydrogenase accessory factor